MKDTKMVLRLTPIVQSLTIDAEGPHNGATLGKLLMRELGIRLGLGVYDPGRTATITRELTSYVHGLSDAHVLDADWLYDMLCKHESVEVLVHEEEQ